MVRLIKKENSSYIKESKQVGDLYHVCTLDAFVNSIIEDKYYNKGKGSKDNLHASGKYTNDLLNTRETISFTRDSSFVVPTDTIIYAPILFQIKVDGNTLSEHHKVYPYQDLKWTGNDPKMSEKEEVIVGPIPNFKSYIKEVHFDIKDINKLIKNKEYVEDLEKVKDYLGSIECTRANLPYKVGDGGYKKTASWEFSINTLDELIDRINSSKRVALSDIDTKDLFDKHFWNIDSLSLQDLNSLYKRYPKLFNKSVFKTLLLKNYDNKDVIKFCLDHGVNVNLLKISNDILQACENKDIGKLKKLLDQFYEMRDADINNIKDDYGITPLFWACSRDNIEIAKLLLEHGADKTINSQNVYGDTPLIEACYNSNINLAKLLLEHGAEVNVKNKDGNTPLYWACYRGNLELAKLLIEHGANTKDKDVDTLLYEVCRNDNIDLAKLLLELGVGVNFKNKDGYTSLYWACKYKDINLAKLLLKYGADKSINVKDYLGRTPFSLACMNNSLTLAKLLLKYGADINIIYKDDNNFVEKEVTALHHICDNKKGKPNIKLAKLLLEHGADPNIKDTYNITPLYLACEKGNLELAKLLIEHGADVNNKGGSSPLLEVCSQSKPNIELVKLLLDHGADFNNKYGNFLNIVRFYGNNIELIKLLLEHGAGKDLDVNNLPDDITKNKQVEELVLSYLNKNKNESVILRRLYRRYL